MGLEPVNEAEGGEGTASSPAALGGAGPLTAGVGWALLPWEGRASAGGSPGLAHRGSRGLTAGAPRVCAGELVRSDTDTENSCPIGHKPWPKHHRFKCILVPIFSVTNENLFWMSLMTNEVLTLKMYSWNYILSHLEFLFSINC